MGALDHSQHQYCWFLFCRNTGSQPTLALLTYFMGTLGLRQHQYCWPILWEQQKSVLLTFIFWKLCVTANFSTVDFCFVETVDYSQHQNCWLVLWEQLVTTNISTVDLLFCGNTGSQPTKVLLTFILWEHWVTVNISTVDLFWENTRSQPISVLLTIIL